MYIGKNLSKYLQQAYPPINYQEWCLSRIEHRYRAGEICTAEYEDIYESFYRKFMWSEIENLIGKVLGCWCDPETEMCHGKILIKLSKEKLLEKRMTTKDSY